jgi:hypothetical protein
MCTQALVDGRRASVLATWIPPTQPSPGNIALLRPTESICSKPPKCETRCHSAYQNGGASLLISGAQNDYRSIQLSYLNLVALT